MSELPAGGFDVGYLKRMMFLFKKVAAFISRMRMNVLLFKYPAKARRETSRANHRRVMGVATQEGCLREAEGRSADGVVTVVCDML